MISPKGGTRLKKFNNPSSIAYQESVKRDVYNLITQNSSGLLFKLNLEIISHKRLVFKRLIFKEEYLREVKF